MCDQKKENVSLDVRFLESFVLVVERGSIAEAARRLNLSAAAVAQRIRILEEGIGAPLVIRVGRTVKPTPAGAAVLPKARVLIQEVRDLNALAMGDELKGELRIGAMSTATTGLLPKILRRLTDTYPKIDVYIMPGASADLYYKVLSGELDAAIIVDPVFPLPKMCEWQTLREEALILIAQAGLRNQTAHTLLEREPFIRYDRTSWGGRIVSEYLKLSGLTPRQRFELDAVEAIAALVHEGLGVALVPDWQPPWPEKLDIVKIPLPADLKRRVGLIWQRSSPRIALLNALASVS